MYYQKAITYYKKAIQLCGDSPKSSYFTIHMYARNLIRIYSKCKNIQSDLSYVYNLCTTHNYYHTEIFEKNIKDIVKKEYSLCLQYLPNVLIDIVMLYFANA